MTPTDPALQSFAALAISIVAATLLWAVSVRLRNASIIDIFWGPFCAAPALVVAAWPGGSTPRGLLLTALCTLWAGRLAWHLARRNIGHGEDYRYAAMRRRHASDAAFARWSLVFVFYLQAALAWFVSLPAQAGQWGLDKPLGLLAAAGIVVYAVGLGFETIGDWQLKRFKANPDNKGSLMTQGLWGWTRHPNYFGDACVWFGVTLIALEGPLGWIGVASPFVMAHFLMNVSGKALLEKGMRRRYPDYDAYARRVSGFFPLPPRRDDGGVR